jgi:hypothetical protein
LRSRRFALPLTPPAPPPLGHCSPPPRRSCCSWPLVACSLFPLQALMNTSAESLPSMLMGTTLAGLVGRSPFRSPDRACFSPSGRRSGHRIWLRKKIPGFKFRRTSSTRNSSAASLLLDIPLTPCPSCCSIYQRPPQRIVEASIPVYGRLVLKSAPDLSTLMPALVKTGRAKKGGHRQRERLRVLRPTAAQRPRTRAYTREEQRQNEAGTHASSLPSPLRSRQGISLQS